MQTAPKFWFAAKRYGWGWGLPLTWQGWVIYGVWFAILLALISSFHGREHVGVHIATIVGMVVALTVICYLKGEPPRWRWGE